MVRHHWISLGIAAVWTLFVLPWFTSHILAWGFISFILLYAFLDVGHARTFRGRPNIKGQDTVLITGNWWQNGHIGLELAKLYARDGFHVMFAALLYNSNIDNKRSETEQLQLKNSDQQLIKDKFKLIQGDLVRINSNIRTHLSIIPFIESFNSSSRTASSSDDKQLNSFDLMSSIESACQSICHGDTDLKGRFRITHLVNCGGALNLENSTMLRDNSMNIDQQLKWLKVYNESLVLFCHYFGKYFREQRLKYPRFDYYILNIGNLDGFAHHIPSLALSSSQRFSTKYSIYHAMESFIQSYSVSLHEELKAFHIHVSCLNNTIGSLSNGEGTVEDTEMSSINSNIAALRSMTPLEIAKIGYRALFTRSRYTIPGYFNYLIGYMWLLLPLSISSYLFPSMFKSTLVSPTGTEFVAEPAEVSAIVASSTTPKEKLTISSGEKSAAAVSTDAAAVVVSPVKDDVLGFKKLDKNALEGDTFGEKASIVQSNNISRSSISTF